MPFTIVRNDLTKMNVDAIVNAANGRLAGGGGVDGAIHRAAGDRLHEACRSIGSCKTGEAVVTEGFDLPCRYVIHTVGPVWHGGESGEKALLCDCYRRSLEKAVELGCTSVAFPLISTGVYGYPKDLAMRAALDTIGDFLLTSKEDPMVYLVIYDSDAMKVGGKLFSDIRQYIDDHYVDLHTDAYEHQRRRLQNAIAYDDIALSVAESDDTLIDKLGALDESFTEMLLRLIDEKGFKDAQCYKKANIDRKLFSKIRSDSDYHPSKATVLSFAVALELPMKDATVLLERAGYAFSPCSKFDVIVQYFIERKNYNMVEINESLFEFDQNLLGG